MFLGDLTVNKTIRLGLPKGSLNMIGRGDTEGLFRAAGYMIRGYTPQKESGELLRIDNAPEIMLSLVRPQNAPGDLARGLLDIIIVGDDWMAEEAGINAKKAIRLASLEYGAVSVVVAVPEQFKINSISELILLHKDKAMTMYGEYPNLAAAFLMQHPTYQSIWGTKRPVIEIRGIRVGENDKFRLIYSEGVTEEYLRKGFPIIDNVQTGDSLKRARGRILEDGLILTSAAGLYAIEGLDKNQWKWEKANEIKDKLLGVVFAQKHYDIKFNTDPENLELVLKYIKHEKLAMKGPTVSPLYGPGTIIEGYAINIIVSKARFPEVSATLKTKLGASGIVKESIEQLIE